MTKDEALKLALEALENHEGNYKLDRFGSYRQEAAITAIEQALAQPVQPQRPWVELTDAEIMSVAQPFIRKVGGSWGDDDAVPDNGNIEDFAQAVSAKLQELNK